MALPPHAIPNLFQQLNGTAPAPRPSGILGPDGRPLPSLTTHAPHAIHFAGLVNAANRAYPWRWDEAYRTSREDALAMLRDGYYITLMKEIWRSVEKMPWSIKPENEKDQMQLAVAEEMTLAVRAIPQWRRFLRSLNWAKWYGRSAANCVWGWTTRGGKRLYTIRQHQHVQGDKIQFGWDNIPRIQIYAPSASALEERGATIGRTDRARALVLDKPEWRANYVIHKYDCIDVDWYEFHEAGAIHGVGVRHWLRWIDFCKKNILAWSLDFLQRTGRGLTLLFYESGNPASETAMQNVAKSISEESTVIPFPLLPGQDRRSGQGVDRIEVSVAGAQVLIDAMDKYFDPRIERMIVGQSMSSGKDGADGLGGTGRAEFAKDTKGDVIQEEAELLEGTLDSDLLDPLTRYNRPNLPFKLFFKFGGQGKESKEKVESGLALAQAGVPIKAEELREAAGFSKPEPLDETVGGMGIGQMPGCPPGQVPASQPGQMHFFGG